MISAMRHHTSYVPVLTEFQGVALIAGGLRLLGIGGFLKVHEYYTGQKNILLFSDDAARCHTELGTDFLK